LFIRLATAAIFAGLLALCEAGPVSESLAQNVPAQNHGGSATSRPGAAPQERLALIRARRELLVCATSDLPSLSWRNARNGELEGLDADTARALAARLSVRAVFVPTTPDTVVGMIERGACDVAMGGMGISPTRAMRVAFTKPYLSGPLAAVTQRSSGRVQGWAGMDREGIVVAVVAGGVAEEVMRQQLKAAELFVITPPLNAEQEIGAGRADVFVTDNADSRRLRDDDTWRVTDAPRNVADTLYAYAALRGDAAWLAELNGFLALSKSDGSLARAAARWGLRDGLVN